VVDILLLIRANLRESVAKNLISVVQLAPVDYATGLRLPAGNW